MKRLLAFGCLLALATSAAPAALDLRIGPNSGADQVDAIVAPGSGEHFFDLTFNETGTPNDEGLIVYRLRIRAPRPGLKLLRAEKPDNWVLAGTDAGFVVDEAAPDRLSLHASDVEDSASITPKDITTGTKAARVYYGVDAATPPGLYRLMLDSLFPAFVSVGPEIDIAVDTSDPGVVRVTPEPSGLALLAAAGLLAGRRVGRAEARSGKDR